MEETDKLKVMNQIKKDTDFLRSINTNDYSLLLGI